VNHFPRERTQEMAEILEAILEAKPDFVAGGRSVEAMDCAGLVVVVCESLGITLDFEDAEYDTIRHMRLASPNFYEEQIARNFEIVPEPTPPSPGDLLLFRMEGGPINHTGWMLPSGEMVHIYDENRGICRTDWTTRFWRPKYAGYGVPRSL